MGYVLMLTKPWSEALIAKKPPIEIVPIRIFLPNIQPKYYNIEALDYLASLSKGPYTLIKICVVIDITFHTRMK